MKNLSLFVMMISALVIISCSGEPGNIVKSNPYLISEKFISDNEYEIVCIGIPKEGLKGVQKEESAKRAALLNAYYFSKNRFDETVSPDMDGRAQKFTVYEDRAELIYIIKKKNLKNRVKN